uniref:Uncharacterized protein n=1 Tax=Anopheles culicifacies TaxID=139723 RepID=A0A182MNX0_9DIPT
MASGSLNSCITTGTGAGPATVCSGAGPTVGVAAATSQSQQPILTLAPSTVATSGAIKVNQPTLQHQRIQSMHHIHHHHHHQLINGIPATPGQRMPANAAAAAAVVTSVHRMGETTHNPAAGWPMVEPVFHFGPGFELETRPFCPAHTPPSEHVVLFHVRPGVAVTFQIAGNRETIRAYGDETLVQFTDDPECVCTASFTYRICAICLLSDITDKPRHGNIRTQTELVYDWEFLQAPTAGSHTAR